MLRQGVATQSFVYLIALSWTAAVAVSFIWNIYLLEINLKQQAHSQADAAIHKDLAYRELVSKAGGVYVPVDKGIEPNPYLSHLPHRDLVTKDNTKLTLINSSYFVRLVHDIEGDMGADVLRGHATSEHPLRAANAPDVWEQKALKLLKQGQKQVAEPTELDGKEVYRLIKPRFTTVHCLTCHTDGYYKAGDVMGGISVSVPLEPLRARNNEHLHLLTLGHLSLWFIGTIFVYLGFQRLRGKEEDLEHNAYHDALTDLPNRKYLMERLSEELEKSKQNHQHGAILLFDLDHFKNINDSLGHPVGDDILKITSKRLGHDLREQDMAARLGGDEFVILLPRLGNDTLSAYNSALAVAQRVQNRLCDVYHVDSFELHISPSIGIAMFPEQGDNVDDILKHADVAMYQSKASGRNQISIFQDSMRLLADERLQLEKDLRKAIQDNELSLHYQPQVNELNQIVGFEALLRWEHDDIGTIPPNKFIRIAEEPGLIFSLGEWVLITACNQVNQWLQQDLLSENFSVSVNISAHQFHHTDFTDQVKNIIKIADIPSHLIKLELTESAIVDDVEGTKEKMIELKKHGLLFSLDDFGTGYSSFSYLSKLPIQQLKVDKSFVRNMTDQHEDKTIVETIVGMSVSLGMDIIAEGVEYEEQLEMLKQLGCNTYQGYLFSRAVPANEASTMLKSQGSDNNT